MSERGSGLPAWRRLSAVFLRLIASAGALSAQVRRRAVRGARLVRRRPLAATVALVVLASLLVAGSLPKRFLGGNARPAGPALKVGELPERATAVSTTRRNKDGSFTAAVYSGPVNYRAPDGSYQRIDTALHPDGRDGYAWRSGANAYTVRFKPSLAAEFSEFSAEGTTVRTSAVGAKSVAARRAGSRVTYAGAYPSADLTYTAGATGVKEVVELANADAPTSYSFTISPKDKGDPLSVRRRADGSWWVMAASRPGPLFVLGAPLVREAGDRPGGGSPAPEAKPTLRVQSTGSGLTVALGLDAGWLHAAGRRFPVQLDPTMTIQPDADDGSFVVGGDQYAWTDERLYVGSTNTQTLRAALRFDLGSVPAGAQVTDAKLGLYYDHWCVDAAAACMNRDTPMDAHRMTVPWTSSTATTADIAYDATVAGSYTLTAGAPQGWMNWPVTDLVQGWLSGTSPNYGVLVKTHTEALGSSGPNPPGMRFPEPSLMPRLELTYSGDGVDLLAPETLHGDGAELAWTRYSGPSGTPFAKYEVHRSSSATFTPSAQTLLATIGDQSQTSYRDTTAAPGRTYTYRVVANSSASNARTVTLPAAGQARKVLQPDPTAGRHTYLHYSTKSTVCKNYGIADEGWVGTSAAAMWRDLLYFDLREIPAGARVTGATASLWEQIGPSAQMTVDAHAVTRDWKEGTDWAYCSHDGATWYETDGGQYWTTPGGDFDSTPAASTVIPAGDDIRFRNFPITSLVQGWVDGSVANNGLLLKAADETLRAGNSVMFSTDDYTGTPALRPKLTVTYTEPSTSQAPTVSVNAPAAASVVRGSPVRLSAAASDNGTLSRVELRVDGVVVASLSAAPWQYDWNSTTVADGTHAVSATAYDEAGNSTTSAGVSVTVDNAGAPTVSVTAPASVTAPVTLSATATPKGSKTISSVAFLVDGVQVAAPDTTAPYSVTWDPTLALAQVFNGSHQITAAATDSLGQVAVSSAATVTVNNTGATAFKAGYTLNNPTDNTDDAFPTAMSENTAAGVPVQDPYAGTVNPVQDAPSGGSLGRSLSSAPHDDMGTPPPVCPANAYCPTLNVTNTSGSTWTSSGVQVWYRWYAPNGAVMYEGKSATVFPASFGADAVQAFPLVVYPPALPPGVQQGTFRLRVDLYDPATGTWFAAKGNQPLDNPVIVAKTLATKLGLERFYQYDSGALGAGMSTLTNVANGDMLLRWTPFFAPGRGLSTMVDLTYNSLEDHSSSPAGNNLSLSMSGLARLGEPIDIHPNKADQISGRSNKWVEVTDGDGTTHHFDGTTGTDGITRWTEPAGVNLYLRSLTGDPNRVWAFTRPDKVTYFFDADGFPTSVEDRNGNKITYVYQDTPPGEDPGGPKKRITQVTDPAGRSFQLAYWSKAEAKKAHVRGKLKTIADHSGSVLRFDYYDDGNLLRLTQEGGTNADGSYLAARSFVFTYTTSNGAGPAIGADGDAGAAARLNPDTKTANQSTRIYSVADPRGNETRFAYYQANDGQQLRWKLKSRTDRHVLNNSAPITSYDYDFTSRITTVTDPLTHSTRYSYDTSGRVTSIVDPANLTTGVEWSTDNKVAKVTEPTGKFSTWSYNDNGYLKTKTDQLQHTTALTYVDSRVDANDDGNHLSQLDTVTTPNGVATATAGDYMTSFSYDSAGNPDRVSVRVDAQTVAVTDYDYNLAGSANPGTLAAMTVPNGTATTTAGDYRTTYPAYDPSGQPTQVIDPEGRSTRVGYNADGNVIWVQDPNHAGDSGTDTRAYRSYFDYDTFGRLGRQSAPKSTAIERGRLLWSSSTFDANDNVVASTTAHYGQATGDPGGGATTRTAYDVMDRPALVTGPDTTTDPAGERTRIDYDVAGRTAKVTKPRGVQTSTSDDFATVYGYDVLDRAVKQTEYGTSTAEARVTQLCYDKAGDLRSITSPRAGTATITCPGTGPATAGFTAESDYDDAHRQITKRDELGHAQRTEYDPNGNITAREADITTGRVARTEVDYDQRDKPVTEREQFDGARDATTRYEYDLNGNRTRVISPRAYDTGGANGPYTQYVTVNVYNQADQLTRTTLPYDSRDGAERQYVHRSYDANGNLAWTSLPVTQPDAGLVGAGAKTTMTYFDPGWIRTSDDPANPAVHFDYTATGKQSQRTPELKSAAGTLDSSRTMSWTYYPDDMVESRSDQGGQPARYVYDADNNMTSSTDSGGVTDPSQKALETQSSFTGFDEVAKTRHHKQGDPVWKFTDYTYDDNGNTTVRRENGEENDAGTQSKAPRRYELDYDGADWLTEQRDLGVDSACLNDTKTVTTFWGTGWERQRDTYRENASCGWAKKQTTNWTHFDNGKLRTLTTKNGAGTPTENHTVSYYDTANTAVYVDGNRTKDTQGVTRGTGSTATTCTPANPCDAVYTYDGRDKLLSESRGGKTTTYKLDEPGGQLSDTTIRAGNVTTQTNNGVATTQRYTGNQLSEVTTAGVTAKYWYDDYGNQDCITTSAGSRANCNTQSPTAAVLADYTYDYLNRLSQVQQFSGGTQTDKSNYVYDALDRTTIENEDHAGTANDRKTDFTYQGLSGQLTEEKQSGGTAPKTKAYSYDNFGHKLGMSNTDNATGAAENFSYGTDVHGSISQLIDDSGNVKASYGYTAYGGSDAGDGQSLTAGDSNAQAPINPMRFSGRRVDSGTATSATAQSDYDMGARRYGPNTGRFLQADAFAGALGDLGLALDPLTQNRYALAGGNPISYMETDGHMAIADGGGGGTITAAPPPPQAEPAKKDDGNAVTNFLGGLLHKGKEKAEDTLKDTKEALDQLDAKTVDNPDWKLHGVYEGWKKFEEKAEPIVGATDVYNCGKEGGASNCAMAALAVVPGGKALKGAKALGAAGRAAEGERVLFGQARISPHFSPLGKVPELRGRHIEDVAKDLRSGRLSPSVFNIRAWNEGGHLVSENNRGLATLSLAGMRPQRGVNLSVVPREQIRRDVLDRLNEVNVFGEALPSTRIGVTPSQTDLQLVSPFEIHIP